MKRIAVILSLMALLLCGCSTEDLTDNIMGAKVVSRQERETVIEESIEDIEGVSKAVVVIRGNAALIGLVLERGYEDKNSDIKGMAAASARIADVNIKSTAVTCNGEITDMIRNLKNLDR